jgi:hypothetical protein
MCIVVNGENLGQLCNTATANEKDHKSPCLGETSSRTFMQPFA